MNHVDDNTLQAFLDDELPTEQRARVAEHLLGCAGCHAAYQELVQAHTLFTRSVALLDVEPPGQGAPRDVERAHGPARAGTASFVKAAGLVLALAAAASAAVPGSPVRAWIQTAVEAGPEADRPTATEAVSPEPEPEAAASRPAIPTGVSIASSGTPIVVALHDLEDVSIFLDEAVGEAATVSCVDGVEDPVFRTGASRIDVAGGIGGRLLVQLPDRGRLEADGRLLAERRNGVLEIHVPADTVNGAILWQ